MVGVGGTNVVGVLRDDKRIFTIGGLVDACDGAKDGYSHRLVFCGLHKSTRLKYAEPANMRFIM